MYTKKPLDRENINVHRVKIVATSTGSTSQEGQGHYSVQGVIEVTVKDENDHKPYFPESNSTVKLSSGLKTGSLVSTVRAFDKDSTSSLRYGLVDGDRGAAFVLDPRSGQLILSRVLRIPHMSISNQDKIPYYRLTIRVYDGLYQDDMTLIVYVVEVPDVGSFSTVTSGHNLAIVISIAAVSSVIIVTLTIAIIAVCRQRNKDNSRIKDNKRPLAGALSDLSGNMSPTDLQRGQDVISKTSVEPYMTYRRHSLVSVHSTTSSLQLTNSFIKVS